MRKPLKVAGWSGVISFVIYILSWIMIFSLKGNLANYFSLIFGVAGGIFGILFLHGFIVLSKKFNSQLLLVMSWIGIVLAILTLIIGFVFSLISAAEAQEEVLNGLNGAGFDPAILFAFLVFWIIVSVVAGAYSILFGIGLLKIKGKVPYAKISGILEIVAGATYIIVVGFLVKMVAFVFEIILMFKASEKFE